jgi:hypothetical protein
MDPRDVFAERVRAQMRRAFFDRIGADIRSGDFESTFGLLEEAKTRLCAVVPKRTDIHRQLDDSIDIDYFKQMVKHDAFETSHIKAIMSTVIDQIKDLGSEHDEPYHEVFKTQVQVRFQRGEQLDVILPFFFGETMSRLDKLENDIEAFRNSEMYKMLMEQRERNEFLKERS